jgi:hypothetical protein
VILTLAEIKSLPGVDVSTIVAGDAVAGAPLEGEIPAEPSPAPEPVLELLYAGGPGTVTARSGASIRSFVLDSRAPGPLAIAPDAFDDVEVTGAPFQLGVRTASGIAWSEPVDPEEG